MSLHLPAELQIHVNEMMATGRYFDPIEVVVEALYHHRDQVRFDRMKHDELKREVMLGIEQLDRGEFVDGPTFLNQLLAEIEGRLPQDAVA